MKKDDAIMKSQRDSMIRMLDLQEIRYAQVGEYPVFSADRSNVLTTLLSLSTKLVRKEADPIRLLFEPFEEGGHTLYRLSIEFTEWGK